MISAAYKKYASSAPIVFLVIFSLKLGLEKYGIFSKIPFFHGQLLLYTEISYQH